MTESVRHQVEQGPQGPGRNGLWWTRGVVLLLLLLLVTTLPDLVEAKPRHDRGDRPHRHRDTGAEVVGGRPISPGSFRYVTAITIDVGDGFIRCGGTLIAPRFVVTAAHCTDNDDGTLRRPEQYELVIGQASLQDPPDANVFGVTAVAVHPDWDATRGQGSDVAILTLEADVPAEIAEPVALIGSGDGQYERAGQLAFVFGWGRTSGNGASSGVLLSAPLTIATDQTCAKVFSSSSYIPGTYLCASRPTAASCNGDSGGPLLIAPLASSAARTGRAQRTRDQEMPVLRAVDEAQGQAVQASRKRRPKPPPPPPLPPLPPRPILVGVVSFGKPGCPTETPEAYTQLSATPIRGFIASVTGQ